MGNETIFRRYEKKYLLSGDQYAEFIAQASEKLQADDYGKYTIYNLYFDTPDYRLIRASLEKPIYKEKLRLRSYTIPNAGSTVFVELKKKYKGIVYKRRVPMTYKQAYYYLMRNIEPFEDNQILSELDWFKSFYKPVPTVNLSYEREAYKGNDDEGFLRITFDKNILWRSDNLDLTKGAFGKSLLEDDERLMEIKTDGAIPLWVCHLLDDVGSFPVSFSKYGSCYQNMMAKTIKSKGVIYCA